MENSLSRNNFQLLAHNYNHREEQSSLKEAQKKLKEIKNGKLSNDIVRTIPEQMMKCVVKSVMEGFPIIETLSQEIPWMISSSNTYGEEDVMEQNKWISGFIDILKLQNDFQKCYVFEECGLVNVWIILQETGLDQNLKYMKLYREYGENEKFSIMLFEQDEEKEVLEQISYISEKCKEVPTNG